MVKNIEILILLNEMVKRADFMMEDIATELEVENIELSELVDEEDENIYELFEQLGKINGELSMLTEELRGSMCSEGFDCEDYARWCSEIEYEPMRITGLFETFEEVHRVLELYISETVRGYRILTQDGYVPQ